VQQVAAALRLRGRGLTFAAIGHRLGLSTSAAHELVTEGLTAAQPRRPSHSPARARAYRRRRDEALRLRLAGFSLSQIGEHFGTGEAKACRLVQAALAAIPAEAAFEVRALALWRLDFVTQHLWPRLVQDRDLSVIDAILKAQAVVMRLYGLGPKWTPSRRRCAGRRQVEAPVFRPDADAPISDAPNFG
jgi:hypothetical protein